jgi:hypothetical protein
MSESELELPPDGVLLLTRSQAAAVCQVSEEIIDQWAALPGFPAIKRSGGHFVRIHRLELQHWLAEFSLRGGQSTASRDLPPEHPRRLRTAR